MKVICLIIPFILFNSIITVNTISLYGTAFKVDQCIKLKELSWSECEGGIYIWKDIMMYLMIGSSFTSFFLVLYFLLLSMAYQKYVAIQPTPGIL